MYYAQKIKEDVPIRDVIESYYGTQPSKGGIHCPNPEHKDKNPSASIKNNRCKCFACNQSFSPIDIVMMNEHCDFPTACQILINKYGLNEKLYSDKEDEMVKSNRFNFYSNELKNIGLQYSPEIRDLYYEAPDQFCTLMARKIAEGYQRFSIRQYEIKGNINYFKNLLGDELEEAEKTYALYKDLKKRYDIVKYSPKQGELMQEFILYQSYENDLEDCNEKLDEIMQTLAKVAAYENTLTDIDKAKIRKTDKELKNEGQNDTVKPVKKLIDDREIC